MKTQIASPITKLDQANQELGEKIRDIIELQRQEYGYSRLDDALDDYSVDFLAIHLHVLMS